MDVEDLRYLFKRAAHCVHCVNSRFLPPSSLIQAKYKSKKNPKNSLCSTKQEEKQETEHALCRTTYVNAHTGTGECVDWAVTSRLLVDPQPLSTGPSHEVSEREYNTGNLSRMENLAYPHPKHNGQIFASRKYREDDSAETAMSQVRAS